MRIKFITTGKEAEVNDGYGLRLIEQGRAVLGRPVLHEKKAAARTSDKAVPDGKAKKKGE